jgi:hypothetical protein
MVVSAWIRVRPLFAALLLWQWLGVAANAHAGEEDVDASTRSAARELGKEAIALYRERNYSEALDRISRAHQLVNLTTTGLWRARCLIELDRLIEASEQLLAVTRMDLGESPNAIHAKGKADAAKELEALRPRIPRLLILVEGETPSDLALKLDGEAIPRALIGVEQPVDPGEHTLSVSGAGAVDSATLRLVEGQLLQVPLRLVDRDPERRAIGGGDIEHSFSPAGVVGFVTLGVGVAGLVVGAISGGLALGTNADLEANCAEGRCPPEQHDAVDSLDVERLTSTVSFVVGGGLGALGLTLVITDLASGGAPDAIEARLLLGPNGCAIVGAF